MAEKDVPYFSPAQRTIGVIAATVAMLAGVFAARQMIPEDNVLPFVAVCMIPVLATLTVWRFWCRRSSPLITRAERQKRYAAETLRSPYWQALLIHGAPAAMPSIAILALHSDSTIDFVRLLAIVLPIAYLAAAATLYFAKERAQRLIDEAAAQG